MKQTLRPLLVAAIKAALESCQQQLRRSCYTTRRLHMYVCVCLCVCVRVCQCVNVRTTSNERTVRDSDFNLQILLEDKQVPRPKFQINLLN